MAYIRKSVWANGGDLDDPILFWYAKAVGALKAKALDDPTSWRFFAGIHGFDAELWESFGYYNPTVDQLPTAQVQATYWRQCQHGTWFFVPWHRGYLVAIESILRAEIIAQGGPQDWALPFWDYSDTTNPNAAYMPPAFERTHLPDGSVNPLYVAQRYGAYHPLPAQDITLTALEDLEFTTPHNFKAFGGPITSFSHSNRIFGDLESKPHNLVHDDIGGDNGIMSDPDSAGLDPIFYLHHANIDRLWSVWLELGNGRSNPIDPQWLQGPIGSRQFIMPLASGDSWQYTPQAVQDNSDINVNGTQLGYEYTPGSGVNSTQEMLSTSENRAKAFGLESFNNSIDLQPVASELIGATTKKLQIDGLTNVVIPLDHKMKNTLQKSFIALDESSQSNVAEPDRVFLKLENVKANREGIILDIYTTLTDDSDQNKTSLVESIGLFGIRKASSSKEEHGGAGLNIIVDITDYFDELHLNKQIAGTNAFPISFVPRQPLAADTDLSIGQISVYREGL